MGLPGSGKSSFYREKLAATHLLISKDRMRSRKRREQRQQRWLRSALEEGFCVAIDNTNPSRAARAPILEIAKQFAARVVAYYFPISVELSLKRNLGPGRAQVPPVAIYSAARDLEVPSFEEGFSEIHEVKFHHPSQFDIIVVI